ncbi:aldolase [Rhodococcus sp. RS1C4]|nr:aldolase/citrate lyase family protein [Rhodococcus sp. RS1C4]OZC46429.1 aldolase [Rhodococcus sp. RS1C4]
MSNAPIFGSPDDQNESARQEARLSDAALDRIESILGPVDDALAADFPGDRIGGQPIHTIYVAASAAGVDIPARWGQQALSLIDENQKVFDSIDSVGVLPRVREALATRPIQDLRIDFEDGYGWRADETEDAHAREAGRILASLAADPLGPQWCGIRPKGLAPHERRRGIRTLELVLDGAGGVPSGFVFTVPKLRAAEQVDAVVALCEEIERAHGLPDRALRFELQIESPQAVVGSDGTATLARALTRADGRCTSLHYGTYDYSAACGITSAQQSLEHPVADHAKAVMLAATAQTGIWVSDGSTQVVPSGTPAEVDSAIRRHAGLVTRSLERGFYQGWDMHPTHLATRWTATLSFFRSAMPTAASRVAAYLDTTSGGMMDEPATAQALAAVLVRGLDCGAVDAAELESLSPLVTRDVLHGLLARTVGGPSAQS